MLRPPATPMLLAWTSHSYDEMKEKKIWAQSELQPDGKTTKPLITWFLVPLIIWVGGWTPVCQKNMPGARREDPHTWMVAVAAAATAGCWRGVKDKVYIRDTVKMIYINYLTIINAGKYIYIHIYIHTYACPQSRRTLLVLPCNAEYGTQGVYLYCTICIL